eukprot:scaffold71485_cov72-Phaeocystis_antarctica.AAC.1
MSCGSSGRSERRTEPESLPSSRKSGKRPAKSAAKRPIAPARQRTGGGAARHGVRKRVSGEVLALRGPKHRTGEAADRRGGQDDLRTRQQEGGCVEAVAAHAAHHAALGAGEGEHARRRERAHAEEEVEAGVGLIGQARAYDRGRDYNARDHAAFEPGEGGRHHDTVE